MKAKHLTYYLIGGFYLVFAIALLILQYGIEYNGIPNFEVLVKRIVALPMFIGVIVLVIWGMIEITSDDYYDGHYY